MPVHTATTQHGGDTYAKFCQINVLWIATIHLCRTRGFFSWTLPCCLYIFAGVRGYMQCNSKGEIYVDGVPKGETSSSTDIWTSVIPRTTRLIAIKAENDNESKKIKASFSNSFKTNTKWKCTTTFHTDWHTIGFDDSDWGYPDSLGTVTGSGRFEGATEIWSGSSTGTVYCRGYMGKIEILKDLGKNCKDKISMTFRCHVVSWLF